MNKIFILNSNHVKLIALIIMLIDHIGLIFLPSITWLRIVGRIAFPIFAFCIAEGAFYTKNKTKYISLILALGILCDVVFYLFMKQPMLCVLTVFALSLTLIFCYQQIENGFTAKNSKRVAGFITLLIVLIGLMYYLSTIILVEYGIAGIVMPLLIYIFKNKWLKLIMAGVGCVLLSLKLPFQMFIPLSIQWYALIAIVVLMFYNGQRGKYNIKYLFYVFYPTHLAVLYLISLL